MARICQESSGVDDSLLAGYQLADARGLTMSRVADPPRCLSAKWTLGCMLVLFATCLVPFAVDLEMARIFYPEPSLEHWDPCGAESDEVYNGVRVCHEYCSRPLYAPSDRDVLAKLYEIHKYEYAVFWYEANPFWNDYLAHALAQKYQHHTMVEGTTAFDRLLNGCRSRVFPYDQINSSYLNGYMVREFGLKALVMAVNVTEADVRSNAAYESWQPDPNENMLVHDVFCGVENGAMGASTHVRVITSLAMYYECEEHGLAHCMRIGGDVAELCAHTNVSWWRSLPGYPGRFVEPSITS